MSVIDGPDYFGSQPQITIPSSRLGFLWGHSPHVLFLPQLSSYRLDYTDVSVRHFWHMGQNHLCKQTVVFGNIFANDQMCVLRNHECCRSSLDLLYIEYTDDGKYFSKTDALMKAFGRKAYLKMHPCWLSWSSRFDFWLWSLWCTGYLIPHAQIHCSCTVLYGAILLCYTHCLKANNTSFQWNNCSYFLMFSNGIFPLYVYPQTQCSWSSRWHLTKLTWHHHQLDTHTRKC